MSSKIVVFGATGYAGAHYVDSTGEIGFVRDLQERHDDRARSTGAVMLPSFGYDYVPGVLAGALAAQRADERAHSLDIGYFVAGSLRGGRGLSQGTRKTVAEGITRPVTAWERKRLVDERAGSRVRSFTVRGRGRQAALASGTEVLYLPQRFPSLESVSVYNGWFPAGQRLFDGVKRRAAGLDPSPV